MANNMMNMQKMLKQAQKIQEQLKNQQAELAKEEFTGSEPSGMVKVVASGDGKIKNIQIDKELIDPDDPDMLTDLLVAAVNDALDQAEQKKEAQAKNLTKGFNF